MADRKDHDGATGRDRAERLASELRANLARRKAQLRSRRRGEADERGEGIALVAGEPTDDEESGRR